MLLSDGITSTSTSTRRHMNKWLKGFIITGIVLAVLIYIGATLYGASQMM